MTQTGKDAILIIGKTINSKFSIEDENIDNSYRLVFETFLAGIDGQEGAKGVLLLGTVGCGKSMCMKVMHQLFRDSRRRFMFKRSADIKDLAELIPMSEIKEQLGYGLKADLYIDDIGFSASEIKKYGNSISPIGELILDRYELYVNEGFLTHFSTNILPESNNENTPTLRAIFGDRTYDRIKEMTNLIVFKNRSLRK